MLAELKGWKDLGLVRAIDYHFGQFISELGADNLTVLSAMFCSEYLGKGHVCLPLNEIVKQLNEKCVQTETDLSQFCERYGLSCLLQNPLSGSDYETHARLTESHCVSTDNTEHKAPLSLQFNALYLRRYALFEQLIADKLLHQPQIIITGDVKTELDRLFAVNYQYVYQAWQEDKKQSVKLLCEKYLHVIENNQLDWNQIESCFKEANSVEDLSILESLIPLSSRCDWQKVSRRSCFDKCALCDFWWPRDR
ncbi:hypothetical protein ACLKMH_18110 [Psychromonas sp. KJ10-10]|uniref:hypothetical protein n=1 Tax=Psychromonas sp. KJ10-10 TaxID=3391823 RepID=UPI0039B372A9